MAKINILPSKVYNRIAAGEVVERPCSVVKELVENAIDAGATEIEIHVEQGGKQMIRVIDNGSGIEREDLQSAFLPHATSKIAKAEDLENIMTLGFRGEAIASISAVSQMTITSKTTNGKCYKLSCSGGELGQISETSGEDGTDVCVENLFYHTPVRLGFLKSDKAEETEITNFVSRFILNRSDISFTYYANGKKVLQSFGGGMEEAMVCVYGASVLSECFCVDAQKHGVRIRGYIGNQNFYKANKSYQSIFLNGRYIVNATISAAISNAYSSYLMKRQYPFYVLHIEIPTEIVDVNVHPNKADVRFADNQIVYGCIYSVIAAILDGQSKAAEYVVQTPVKGGFAEEVLPKEELSIKKESSAPISTSTVAGFPILSYEEAKKEIEENAPAFVAKKMGMELPFQEEKKEESEIVEEEPVENIKVDIGYYNKTKDGFLLSTRRSEWANSDIEEMKKQFPDLFYDKMESEADKQNVLDTFAANKEYLAKLEKQNKQNRIEVSTCKYAGKLFNTYLLYEKENNVYIIDQHAAHERLIFDRLKSQMAERKIIRQPMFIPFTMKFNAFESEFIRENIPSIREMGFIIYEKEENMFEVTEVPVDLQAIRLDSFFHEILGDISNYRAIKLENLLKDKLASAACKAAVKGGMDLTQAEIDGLFALMDGDMGLKCPHGRPVVVKMSKFQLEKMFKRIV